MSWHQMALLWPPASVGCWYWHWDKTMHNCYNCQRQSHMISSKNATQQAAGTVGPFYWTLELGAEWPTHWHCSCNLNPNFPIRKLPNPKCKRRQTVSASHSWLPVHFGWATLRAIKMPQFFLKLDLFVTLLLVRDELFLTNLGETFDKIQKSIQ